MVVVLLCVSSTRVFCRKFFKFHCSASKHSCQPIIHSSVLSLLYRSVGEVPDAFATAGEPSSSWWISSSEAYARFFRRPGVPGITRPDPDRLQQIPILLAFVRIAAPMRSTETGRYRSVFADVVVTLFRWNRRRCIRSQNTQSVEITVAVQCTTIRWYSNVNKWLPS